MHQIAMRRMQFDDFQAQSMSTLRRGCVIVPDLKQFLFI